MKASVFNDPVLNSTLEEIRQYVLRLEGRVDELSKQVVALQAAQSHRIGPGYRPDNNLPGLHVLPKPEFYPDGLRVTCGPTTPHLIDNGTTSAVAPNQVVCQK